MSYAFIIPLRRKGIFYLHQDTLKEILRSEAAETVSEIELKYQFSIVGYYEPLSLIKIKNDATQSTKPGEKPYGALQSSAKRKRISYDRYARLSTETVLQDPGAECDGQHLSRSFRDAQILADSEQLSV